MKVSLSTICIVIPYFGKWPFWMPFFLASCRENPTVNWLIYTDCGVPKDMPDNVTFVDLTYSDYCLLVSDQLNIVFKPQNPYKLCDIKPALGYIHQEQLAQFDYWAFGDLDLVYGNLRAYFTEARLSRKQVFSMHATRTSGHLCLLQNTPALSRVFKKVKGWESKFTSQVHLAFDEKDFSKIFLRHKNSPKWVRKLLALKDPWLKVAEFNEAYTTPNGRIPWVDGTFNFPTEWAWSLGGLTVDNLEGVNFPYFHFLIWKEKWRNSNLENDHFLSYESLHQSQLMDFSVTESGFHL